MSSIRKEAMKEDDVMRDLQCETSGHLSSIRNAYWGMRDVPVLSDHYTVEYEYAKVCSKKGKKSKKKKVKWWRCKQCNRRFGKKHDMILHHRESHVMSGQNRLYHCNMCRKAMKTKRSLIDHIKSRHIGVQYHCPKCNAAYSARYKVSRCCKGSKKLDK